MIRYALRCECGHGFESWFQSSATYESQRKRRLVTCPACDSAKIEKAIMAPRLAANLAANLAAKGETGEPKEPANETSAPTLMMAPQERELAAKLRDLREHVEKNAENVGRKFPNEARKIHYGDSEHRAIYGQATAEEARSLIEEGVEVMPLPLLPDERN